MMRKPIVFLTRRIVHMPVDRDLFGFPIKISRSDRLFSPKVTHRLTTFGCRGGGSADEIH